MQSAQHAIGLIRAAWDHEIEPLGRAVTDSMLDDETSTLVKTFGGIRDWRALSAETIDDAPDGLGSALAFFSDPALRYFIASYMVADLEGKLRRAEPLFSLTHGFDSAAYGATAEVKCESEGRWRGLSDRQIEAIIAYLKIKRDNEIDRPQASAALDAFWNPRSRMTQ